MKVWTQKLGDGAVVAKTTVRPDGSIVGRNFKKDLRPGEIGLKCILDLSKVDPDQLKDVEATLQDAIDAVMLELKERAGCQSGGYQPGMVVVFDKGESVGIVDSDRDGLVRLRRFRANGRLVQITRAMGRTDFEEVLDHFGAEGLLRIMLARGQSLPKGFTTHCAAPDFLLGVFVSGSDCMDGETDLRFEALEKALACEDPYQHFELLKAAASAEKEALHKMVLDFCLKSDDDRRFELCSKLARHPLPDKPMWGEFEKAEGSLQVVALAAIPNEQQDLLEGVACNAVIKRVTWLAMQRVEGASPEVMEGLCRLFKEAAKVTSDLIPSSLLLPILRALETKPEFRLEIKGQEGYAGFCPWSAWARMSHIMQSVEISGLLRGRTWVTPEAVSELKGMRIFQGTPEGFWWQLQQGFDPTTDDPQAVANCARFGLNFAELLALGEHLVDMEAFHPDAVDISHLKNCLGSIMRSESLTEEGLRAARIYARVTMLEDASFSQWDPTMAREMVHTWLANVDRLEIDIKLERALQVIKICERPELLIAARGTEAFEECLSQLDARVAELEAAKDQTSP